MSTSVALHYDRLAPLAITRETDPMTKPIVPTLIDLPSELRGPRVLLRPWRADDAEQLFAAIDESRDHIRPWMTWVDNNRTVDDVRDYCVRSQASWLLRTELALGIFDAASERCLGGTGLHDPDWQLRAFETGYWLRLTVVGHGYATDSTQLLADFALSHLQARRISLHCDARNDANHRVAERAGFTLEGRLRNVRIASDSEPSDELIYAVVPRDREQSQVR
jgi:RimJ/RimL family protein N-acetyltransferase